MRDLSGRGRDGPLDSHDTSQRTTMGGDDEAAQLSEAARLPWAERFKHSFWKARVAAYECVGKEAATADDVQSNDCLRAFGTCATRCGSAHIRMGFPYPSSRAHPKSTSRHPLPDILGVFCFSIQLSLFFLASRGTVGRVESDLALVLPPPSVFPKGDCAKKRRGRYQRKRTRLWARCAHRVSRRR